MERLTTSSESHGPCLTLCYQSLQGAVSQMGVDNQQSTGLPQMTLETASPAALTHINADGSAATGVAQLRIDGSAIGVDSQAAMAVQSLLESQQTPDPSVEEEDLFQCGRCKKQFTSLTAFIGHKQTQCVPLSTPTPVPQTTQLQLPLLEEPQQHLAAQQQQSHQQSLQQLQQPIHQMQNLTPVQNTAVKTVLPSSHAAFSNTICTVAQQGQPLTTFTTIPTSPLSQLPQGVVLTDDLMTFANLDAATLQGSTIHMVAGPFNARSTSGVTILSTVQPASSFSAQGSNPFQQPQQQPAQLATFTPQQTIPSNSQLASFPAQPTVSATLTPFSQQTLQTVPQQAPHPITITLPEKQPSQPITISLSEKQPHAIIRRTPTKASRKSSQSQAAASAGLGVEGEAVVVRSGSRRGGRGGGAGCEEKRRTLQCQYCSKLFSKNFDLQQHLRAHTGEKPFQCIVCGRAFAQKSNVKKHMATHKVWPSGTSTTLPKQPPPETLDMEGGEPMEEQVEEEEEGVMISVPEQQHQGLVKDDPETDAKVEEEETLDGGQQLKTKVVVDNSYICQYCSEKFKTFFQLKTHMVKHKSEQVYKCVMKKCGQSFKDLETFLEHTKTHENEMTYRCHLCNKYFASLYDLGCHQYTHNLFPSQGMKSGPRHFQCTRCGNKYTTPEALEHHMATTSHQYPCPHCNKVFSCERFLRRHLPIHGTEGQFECMTCQKRFKTEHCLKSHQLIHTGETPYQCETCQAAFNRKDKLKRHMTIHEAVKKFRCPFKSLTGNRCAGCSKEFNRPDKLKSHIITHSGIKPFKCSVCGKGFSRRPHMLEHERGHKSDFRFKCDKCGRGFFRSKLFTEHKCHPGKANDSPLFRPRRRRKIGRPRKRSVVASKDDLLTEEVSGMDVKRHHQGTPGLRSASGIHLQSARVAAAIASQMKGSGRSRGSRSTVDSGAEVKLESVKDGRMLDEHDESTPASEDLTQLTTLNEKELVSQVLPGELDDEQVIDHYVVHLADCSDGGVAGLHTTLTPATLQAGLATGTLQPITIIEATPVHMAGANTAGMIEAGLPVVTVSRSGEVVVAAASDSPGQQQPQTFVTCTAELADFTGGDPVLQGTESLLKASAELLHNAEAGTHSLQNP